MLNFGNFCLGVLALVLMAAPVMAAEVGEAIPHKLEVRDQNGGEQSFEALTGERGAVLVFVRSADWCPYCQAQLIELGEQAGAITDLGYTLVTISYDSVEKLKAFSDKYRFGYTMLSDEGSAIIKAFGVLNEEMDPNSDWYGIPHPAVFVVSRDGTITAKLMEDGYKARPPVTDIVTAIRR